MKPSKPAKAALRLRRNKPVAREIRRIARSQIDAACHVLQSSENPRRAVHEARKALKKLRAILQLVSAEFSRSQLRREKRAFQEAARLLAPLRDAEVQILTAKALIQGAGLNAQDFSSVIRDFEAFAEQLARESGEARRRAVEMLSAARKGVRRWPLPRVMEWKTLEREIRRAYKKGRKALRTYQREPAPEAFHAWRKRVKELWYHLRITEHFFSGAVANAIEQCDKIGELAGNAHDLEVLRERLIARAQGSETKLLTAKIEERLPEYYQTAVEQGTRLYAQKPREFMKGVGGG